jgi:hypothetical protein
MRSKAQPRPASQPDVRFRDMHAVVCDVLVAMKSPGPITVFRLDEKEVYENLVLQIKRDCPTLGAGIG